MTCKKVIFDSLIAIVAQNTCKNWLSWKRCKNRKLSKMFRFLNFCIIMDEDYFCNFLIYITNQIDKRDLLGQDHLLACVIWARSERQRRWLRKCQIHVRATTFKKLMNSISEKISKWIVPFCKKMAQHDSRKYF